MSINPCRNHTGSHINGWCIRIGAATGYPCGNGTIVVACHHIRTVLTESPRIPTVFSRKAGVYAHFQHTTRKCAGTLFLIKTAGSICTHPENTVWICSYIINGSGSTIGAIIIGIVVVVAEGLAVLDSQITFQYIFFLRI